MMLSLSPGRLLLAAVGMMLLQAGPAIAATTSALVLKPEPGPNPWTNVGALAEKEPFRFAIVADRAGGARPEIFRDAMYKLNLLRPDFVMCVGDLIPGYTTNRQLLDKEWDEVLTDVRRLKMPFFFTPGNHDLTNDVETSEWHSRFGRTYYHFLFRDCLFLVLNSETPSGKRLPKEEIEHFRRVVEEHGDARWTFVFLHGPIWMPGYEQVARRNKTTTLWPEFEELLKGHEYSVFAGHLHNYSFLERNGHNYYVLATTGGGSGLRDAENYGEMDHIMWVTMTSDGPVVANIETHGVHAGNYRTEEGRHIAAIAGRAVRVRNIPPADGIRGTAHTRLLLANDSRFPMHVTIDFDPGNRAEVAPDVIEQTLAPMTTATQEIRIDLVEPSEISAPGPVVFSWDVRYEQPDRKPLEFSGRKAIGFEHTNVCPRRSGPVSVDGNLKEWKNLRFMSSDSELLVAPESKPKRKRRVGSFRFATQYDSRFVYFGLQMIDRKVLTDPTREPWKQDGVQVRLDARPDRERSGGRGEGEGTNFVFVAISPGKSNDMPTSYGVDRLPAGSQIACERNSKGYAVELAIPVSYFNERQKGQWKAFRLNVAATDYNKKGWRGPTHLAWRPDWRSELNYEGSGTFVRK